VSSLPTGFDPDFDDTAWNLDWLDIPIRQIPAGTVPVGEQGGGYRVTQEVASEVQIFGRPYRLDPPLDVRLLFDPAGTLWMSDTPQERIMMYNNARRSGGHVLVGGAGLGLYPQYVTEAESFTIVEHSPVVLKLVGPLLKEAMDARRIPLRFLLGDIEAYLDGAEAGGYDTIFLDTWPRLDASLLPQINRLRDAAARHLAPGGRLLLWGYRWMVRLFEEASATFLLMPPGDRENWLAAQAEVSPLAAAMLAPVAEAFRGREVARWDLDAAVADCRGWVLSAKA
jgi:SAM-dependent methyltransferase